MITTELYAWNVSSDKEKQSFPIDAKHYFTIFLVKGGREMLNVFPYANTKVRRAILIMSVMIALTVLALLLTQSTQITTGTMHTCTLQASGTVNICNLGNQPYPPDHAIADEPYPPDFTFPHAIADQPYPPDIAGLL
jgi:hypothetical protein